MITLICCFEILVNISDANDGNGQTVTVFEEHNHICQSVFVAQSITDVKTNPKSPTDIISDWKSPADIKSEIKIENDINNDWKNPADLKAGQKPLSVIENKQHNQIGVNCVQKNPKTRDEKSHTGKNKKDSDSDVEKRYTCPECFRHFVQANQLKTHLRQHTGERPYACGECLKRFTAMSSLNSHMRVHTGERPYKCRECNQQFRQLSSLRKHFRVHSNDKVVLVVYFYYNLKQKIIECMYDCLSILPSFHIKKYRVFGITG